MRKDSQDEEQGTDNDPHFFERVNRRFIENFLKNETDEYSTRCFSIYIYIYIYIYVTIFIGIILKYFITFLSYILLNV